MFLTVIFKHFRANSNIKMRAVESAMLANQNTELEQVYPMRSTEQLCVQRKFLRVPSGFNFSQIR